MQKCQTPEGTSVHYISQQDTKAFSLFDNPEYIDLLTDHKPGVWPFID